MRIYHDCDEQIGQSVPKIIIWHRETCRLVEFLTQDKITDILSSVQEKNFLNYIKSQMSKVAWIKHWEL